MELYPNIIYVIITIAITLIIVKIIRIISNKTKEKSKLDISIIDLMKDFLTYTVYIIGLIIIFEIFGIDFRSIFVSIGIVSIIISFATKDILSNFISGIFIISDQNIKVGDTIEIGSIKGKIEKISFRTTTIADKTGIISVIPNSVFSNTPYNKFKDFEDLRIDLIATIPLNINIEEFKKEVLNNIKNINELCENKLPGIYSQKITEEGVIIKISLWITDSTKLDDIKLQVTNDIRLLIEEY